MAARMIRSTLTRFVLIAGLAAALFVGSFAVGRPTEASAAPMSCGQAIKMAEMYTSFGDIYLALGSPVMASTYYGRAQGVLEAAC